MGFMCILGVVVEIMCVRFITQNFSHLWYAVLVI